MYKFTITAPKNPTYLQKERVLVLFLASLSNLVFGQTALKYVPSTADVVVTVNLQNLDKKVNVAQLKQYDFFQAMLKEMNQKPELENDTAKQEFIEKLFTDPTSLGFDTSEPFYFFAEKVGYDTYLTFVQKMGDKNRYELAVQDLKKAEFSAFLTEQGGLKIWQKGPELFAWNTEVVINVVHQKGYDPAASPEYYDTELEYDYEEMEGLDSTYLDTVYEADSLLGDPDLESDTLQQYVPTVGEAQDWLTIPDTAALQWAVKVLNQDFLQPIARNDRFALAKGKTDDVHVWVDYGFFNESMLSMQQADLGMGATNSYQQMLSAMGGMMDVFYGDTYLSMGLNFEKGRMAIRSQLFFNEDMKRFYQRALKTKFNKKFLRYVKGGDELFGYFYLNYNIKNTIEESKSLLYKIFDATPQYGEAAADLMKIIGIFLDEDAIGNLLKGDLMVAVSGIQTVEVTTQTYDYDEEFNYVAKDTTRMQEVPIFTALSSYGSGKDIQKFIDFGVHSKALVQEGGFYRLEVPGMSGMAFFLAKHKGLLLFTNNAYLMRQNLESGFAKKLRLPKNHKKRLCESASVLYWNIPNTIRAAAGGQADSNVGMMGYLNQFGKEFYSMEMTSSKKVDDSLETEMFLNMTGRDTNVLQQFFNFVNDIYLETIGGAKI